MRELDINIVVNDEGAKQQLAEVDRAVDQTAATAQKAAQSIDVFEKRMQTAAATAQTTATQLGTVRAEMQTTSVAAQDLFTWVDRGGIAWGSYAQKAQAAWSILRGLDFATVRTGINAIGESAGLTVESLGMMNSAGLVIGTAYASWGIGRMIADFTGLDKIVGQATATLIGWSDAQQVAAAKQDSVNLAIQRGADAHVTYTDALKFNDQWVKNNIEGLRQLNDVLAQQKAPETAAKMLAGWREEIENLRRENVLDGLRKDIESNEFSVKHLTETYRISAEALTIYQRELKAAADAQKKANEEAAKYQEALTRASIAENGYEGVLRTLGETTVQAIRWTLDHGAALADVAKEYGVNAEAVRVIKDQLAEEVSAGKLVEEMYKRRLEVSKQLTQQLQAESQAWLKVSNDAIVAELNARQAINAARGLDINGNPSREDDPMTKLNRTIADLDRQKALNPGIADDARRQQAYDEFYKATMAAAKADDALATASTKASEAAEGLSRSHAGATAIVDATTAAFASFKGVMVAASLPSALNPTQNGPAYFNQFGMPLGNSAGMPVGGNSVGMLGGFYPTGSVPGFRASGGDIWPGQSYWVGEKGPELITPRSAGVVSPTGAAGGISIGEIHIHGNVDSELRARDVADKVAKQIMRQQTAYARISIGKR